MNDPNQPHWQQPYPQQQQQPYPPQQQQPYPQQQQQPYPPQQQQPYPPQQQQQPYPQYPQQPYPQYPHYPQHPQYPPYAPGFAAYPPGAYARPQYEFTPEQNQILADVALWCGGLSILKFIEAVLGFLGRNWLGGAIELAVALTLWGGRTSMRAVVDTTGNDVGHLMTAVDKLATVFQIRLILSLIGAVIITVIVAIFVALAIAAPEVLDEIMRGL